MFNNDSIIDGQFIDFIINDKWRWKKNLNYIPTIIKVY